MIPAVIAKIISMKPNFTLGENEIAQYIINNADVVVTSTITTIAKNTGTSDASVNRFCKKLGYKGFNSFKIALAQENFYNNSKNALPSGEKNNIIASVSNDYQHLLVNTSAMLDENTLNAAAKAMKTASRIFIFSLSNTAFIAKELEFRLELAGIFSKAVVDINTIPIAAANTGKDDFVIVIVPSILMRDIYQIISTCKEHGATILSITSYDSPKLNDLVNFKLVTSDIITAQNAVSLSNNLIFLYVIDVLYSVLLASDKTLKERKLNRDAIMNNTQAMEHYTLDY